MKIKHVNRYREIAAALVKYGFGYIVKDVGLFHMLSLPKKLSADFRNGNVRPLGERLRLMLEELGPTFIKLGQLLSIRRDLIPAQLAEQLEKLQDEVRPIPTDRIKEIIAEELGASCEKCFALFDETCIAAASIGQVHRAVLPSGEEVAVKIRRPNIETLVENDIEILRDLARMMEQHYSWAVHYQVRDIVDELAQAIRNEMDYLQEGRNTEKIRQALLGDRHAVVPAVYWTYSTKKILTTEWIHGEKFTDIRHLPAERFNNSRLAERLVTSFLTQVFGEGIYHGDPHPGNLFFLPGDRIAYVDFGQVGFIRGEMKQQLASFLIGLMKKDIDLLMETVIHMAVVPHNLNEQKLRIDLEELQDKYYDVPLGKIDVTEAVTDLFQTAQEHQLIIPKDYTMLGKALMTIESLISALDPNLSLIELAEPFGKKLILERLHPRSIVQRLFANTAAFVDTLLDLPENLKKTLQTVEKGQTEVQMKMPQLEELLRKLDRVGNRISFSVTLLAFSIVFVGLIIGATFGNSFLTHVPAIEVGIVIAFFMFLWIIFSILKSGRF